MLALGCDHGGYPLMKEVIKYLEDNKIAFKNFGTYSEASVDYPEYAKKVAHAVAEGECEKGILICGTGIGISIAANKVRVSAVHCAAMCSPQRQPESIMMQIFWRWAHE